MNQAPSSNSGISIGWAAVAIGVVGVFFMSFLLSPLAILLGLFAILRLQLVTGLLAIVAGLVGVLTSPVLMGLIGFSALAIWGLQSI